MSSNRPTSQQVMMTAMLALTTKTSVQGLPKEAPKNDLQHNDSKRYFQPAHEKRAHNKPHHLVQQPTQNMGKRR